MRGLRSGLAHCSMRHFRALSLSYIVVHGKVCRSGSQVVHVRAALWPSVDASRPRHRSTLVNQRNAEDAGHGATYEGLHGKRIAGRVCRTSYTIHAEHQHVLKQTPSTIVEDTFKERVRIVYYTEVLAGFLWASTPWSRSTTWRCITPGA
jgi:hypothetical protein